MFVQVHIVRRYIYSLDQSHSLVYQVLFYPSSRKNQLHDVVVEIAVVAAAVVVVVAAAVEYIVVAAIVVEALHIAIEVDKLVVPVWLVDKLVHLIDFDCNDYCYRDFAAAGVVYLRWEDIVLQYLLHALLRQKGQTEMSLSQISVSSCSLLFAFRTYSIFYLSCRLGCACCSMGCCNLQRHLAKYDSLWAPTSEDTVHV